MTKIVTCNNQTLDLTAPKDADAFLAAMRNYGEAARCEWGAEYLLAQRTVSTATYDATRYDIGTRERLCSGGV